VLRLGAQRNRGMRKVILTLWMVTLLGGCVGQEGSSNASGNQSGSPDLGRQAVWEFELMKEDRAFSTSVQLDAPPKWSAFLAPNGTVLQSGVGEMQGPDAVTSMFTHALEGGTVTALTWGPERAEVSESGDLGYTVGRYFASGIDSAGGEVTGGGSYLTVWRRQSDGAWRVEVTVRIR
jgi:ketosteroid isomerase-like protein